MKQFDNFFSKLKPHIFTFDEKFYVTDNSVDVRLQIYYPFSRKFMNLDSQH